MKMPLRLASLLGVCVLLASVSQFASAQVLEPSQGALRRSLALTSTDAPTPHNVAQLSATASAEAPQDQLLIVLATTREAASAAQVQAQLSQAVDAALVMGRSASQPGQLEVRSGSFGLQPRHNREGQVNGWQGTAQVLLEGRDFAGISALAGRITTLQVSQVSLSLSRELKARLQTEAQAQAITQFKQSAEQITRGFGLSSYTVREVSFDRQDAGDRPLVRATAAQAMVAAPVPVEAGKESVSVTISGSVQMQ